MRRLKNGRTRQNWVKVPSQKGMRISIKAALKVQEIMKTKYNLPFLMGSRINQCYLENFFCQIRQMNENVPRPSALQFNRRVAKWIIHRDATGYPITRCPPNTRHIFNYPSPPIPEFLNTRNARYPNWYPRVPVGYCWVLKLQKIDLKLMKNW